MSRCGLENSFDLSVIADGAPWIWEQAKQRLSPQESWCVDVYDVSETLHRCAKVLFGEGESARTWAQGELEELIRTGGPKYLRRLDEQIAQTSAASSLQALNDLRTYLQGNGDRMWYAQRLSEGKPIGSGAIEGRARRSGRD